MLTAAHCSTPEVSLEVARLGEWHVVDTSTFNNRCRGHWNYAGHHEPMPGHCDARTCLYYDSVTRAQCEQFPGCRNTCELQAGDVDCEQLPAPSTSSRCSQPHQVGHTTGTLDSRHV